MRRFILSLVLLALSGAICIGPLPAGTSTPESNNSTDTRVAKLVKFTSAEEMRNYLADEVASQPSTPYYPYAGGFGCAAASPSIVYDMAVPTAGTSNSASSDDSGGDVFSTTNIQEADVDESDVVKNDGTFIYLLRNDSLRIVRAVPADALTEVGTLDLEGFADSLYLKSDQIVALSSKSGVEGTIVTVIDVSDRTNPVIQQTWQLDGRLATSRLIGDKLHLVLTATPRVPYGSNGDTIRFGSLDTLLPGYQVSAPGGNARKGNLADWPDFYHPTDMQGYGLTIVTTINLADLSAPPESTGITADAGVIYASTSALYVTDSQNNYWYYRRGSDDTMVHKFDLSGDRSAYVGSALVPGHLLNQYSLGEKDGYLRLGSTVGQVSRDGNSSAVNAVYVLAEGQTAGLLDIVGKVEDIAPGEKIYSARFVGDRGFLVTFKKVDPLYTLDMSDPKNPRIVGRLKVPGYSDYIHPMDADHLLTIGKDAFDEGTFAWYQGVQLSIFDITDFADPQLLAKEIVGVRGTESEANENPKAFNYFASKNALAIPIHLAEGPTQRPDEFGQFTFTGLYVYHAAVDDGFELLGRISTNNNSQPYYYYYGGSSNYTRGIFIGDSVYAVSDSVVTAAPTADPSQTQSSVSLE